MKQIISEKSDDYYNGFNIDKLIIADAEDLSSIDTACYIDNTGATQALTSAYDEKAKTLTISNANGGIVFNQFERIHYLQKGVDHNLCDASSDFYTTDKIPDLSGSTASMDLTSATKAAVPITMKFTAHQDLGIVRIKWSYTTQDKDVKTPFEVPTEIIGEISKDPSGKLSDWVQINKDQTSGVVTVTVLDSNEMPSYTLNGF